MWPLDGNGAPEVPTLVTLHRFLTPVDVAAFTGMDQMFAAAQKLGLLDSSVKRPGDAVLEQEIAGTVADVVTSRYSPEPPPRGWKGHPADLGPHQDFLSRALGAIQPMIRAAKLAGDWHVIEPTYERLPQMLLYFEGLLPFGSPLVPEVVDWQDPQLLQLEHTNFINGRWAPDPERESYTEASHSYWMRSLASGTPAVAAREMSLESERMHREQGDYASGSILLWTGLEVLSDSFLSVMLWEQHLVDESQPGAVESARSHFRDSTAVQRARKELPRLLGGDWSSHASPWVRAHRDAYQLRNRIIHSGYRPTRAEAELARKSVDTVQRFLFDRLAGRASVFPRAAQLIVGTDGMERRGLSGGKFGRFITQRAQKEAPWLEAWATWHRELVEEMGR